MRRSLFAIGFVLLASLGCSQTKSDSCPSTLPGWTTPAMGQPHFVVANVVTMRGREVLWNGVPVDEEKLASYLKLAASMKPLPFLIFDPDESDCEDAARLRDLIDRSYPCRDGSCGQGTRSAFDAAPFRDGR